MRRTRTITLASLLLAGIAAAQPNRVRLGSAKEEAGPAAASSPSCSDADTALARGLVYAFEAAPLEIRVIAIEDLALLGDPRALDPLSQLVLDPSPLIQAAALRAVSKFHAARAQEILENVVRSSFLHERLKLQAVEALMFQRTPTAREFLARVSTSTSFPYNVRKAAQKALEAWGPPPTN